MKKIDDLTDVERYNPSPVVGLSDEQVSLRKKQNLVNKVAKKVPKSYFKIIFDNVFNFFNLLLFAIAALILIAGGGFSDFIFIYILSANIIIGLIQDIRARKQIDKLKLISDPRIRVVRNGKVIEVASKEVVLDDIVIFSNGNQIIADAIVVDGTLEVNESLLTGESVNIVKKCGDKIFSGSFVTSGNARCQIESIGKDSYAERLQAKASGFKRPKSEILATIHRLFKFIGAVVITLGIAMIVTLLINGDFRENFKEATLRFSGSMVAMIPTGLFLLTSLTLAVGVIKLSKKRTYVQELYSIETLARVDTLCLDKTGTITDGKMMVKYIVPFAKEVEEEIKDILFTLVDATKDDNPTAEAIRKSFANAQIKKYTSSIPFNSKRKYSSVSLSDGRCYVLGAKEFLNIDDKKIMEEANKYEKDGYRVLLLAYSKKGINIEEELKGLTPVALIVLEEHIKDDAIETIKWFENNGVKIKIISGDNPVSVSEIAKRVGVIGTENYVSLENKDIDEVKRIANETTVFGRVSPEQKEAIITSLQENGHTVAMTGDGVNDILALKVADCSIAMASGSDAAKAVSHLVSLDSNFSSLPSVVKEGRRVINNLQRTCSVFLVKTIFAMILTLAFLISSWANGPTYPFTTHNLYIWELLTIGFSSFFLSLQPNDEQIKNSFIKNIATKAVPAGIIQALTSLFYFFLSLVKVIDFETAKVMSIYSFTILSFVTLLFISFPFDIYRGILCIAIGLLIPILILLDYFAYMPLASESFFKIKYDLITPSNWWILALTIFVAAGIYFAVHTIIAKKLKEK